MLFKPAGNLVKARIGRSFLRTLVTETKNEEATSEKVKPKKATKTRLETKATREISAYFNVPERQFVLKSFPDNLLKRKTKPPESLYNTSNEAASIIVDVLKKNLQVDKPIIEVNPGIGLITKKLLEETNNDLILFEPEEKFHDNLSSLIRTYPKRNVLLKPNDFTALWRMAYIDKLDRGSRVDETLKGINKTDFENEPNARVFSITSSLSLIKHFINSIIFNNSLMALGRCEFFLCLHPPLYMHLTCSKEAGYLFYRATSVLFQILFDYRFICRLNRKDFLPWMTETRSVPYAKVEKYNQIDPESMYLIRAVPRRDLFDHCMPENLPYLWFFVKQHLMSRKNRVIPTLECWIPNSGPRLIVNTKTRKRPELLYPDDDFANLPPLSVPCSKLTTEDFVEDINIFTEFGDLTPTNILTVFDQFINWPEYRDCSFIASLEATLMKLHTSPEEAVDVGELPDDDEIPREVDVKNL